MEIKTIPISDLKPHPSNPRIHPDNAINALVKSITEFGWTNPVLVSKDGYILAGHARVKAAEKAGLKEVPVIKLPFSGEKAKAYLITDNKLQDMTEWDLPLLTDLLLELDTGDLDIEITGFDEKEIETLMTQLHVPENIEDTNNPLGQLFVYNPKWNNRRSIKYLSLCSYRSNKHKEAVQYFKSIKKECPDVMIKELGQFITDEIIKTFRNIETFIISNCPKTHSKTEKHFATELALSVSQFMRLEYRKLFKDRDMKGTTSPRNYYMRLKAEIDGKLDKPVILIDDIASSGTTMESCIKALKDKVFVIPIVLVYEDFIG